jgi:hypothetical protein
VSGAANNCINTRMGDQNAPPRDSLLNDFHLCYSLCFIAFESSVFHIVFVPRIDGGGPGIEKRENGDATRAQGKEVFRRTRNARDVAAPSRPEEDGAGRLGV